jgi:hypothetical protein
MNEQIEQLALQATDTIEVVNPDTGITHNREFFDKEKFALLIVQECINKIETHKIPVGNSAAGEMACEWTYDALKQIRDEIKEHFGVSE